MSQTEKAIVAMLREQINGKTKPAQAALLQAIRMIEAGVHVSR